MARAAAGDQEARRELFEGYRTVAYEAALRIVGRDADALDVVQDAFIRAFANLAGFSGQASFKTWLLRIVSNRALDVVRARRVRIAVPLDAPGEDGDARHEPASPRSDPLQDIEAGELGERLRQAIERLPIEQRTVFALHASGDMTYGEIAEAVGVPVGTVMSRLFHARRKLHEWLSDLAPRTAQKD